MKQLHDLDTFAKILTDKGYDGYFTVKWAHPGKIKESISKYLESCRKGTQSLSPVLMLLGYLRWTGVDKPWVECCMWVKHENGKFDLREMEIEKKDRFGQLLKQVKLTNISAVNMPKVSEAIAMVNEEFKQKVVPRNKRSGFKK